MRISNKLIIFIIALNIFIISSSLAADFNFTTTNDFLNGTRYEIAYASGFPPKTTYLNYYTMETCEDNLYVECGDIRVANRLSDGFGDAHRVNFTVSGDKDWKWKYYETEDSGGNHFNEVRFENGRMVLELMPHEDWTNEIYLEYTNFYQVMGIAGDFNVTIDFMNYNDSNYDNVYFSVMLSDSNDIWGGNNMAIWVSSEGGVPLLIDDNSFNYQLEGNPRDADWGKIKFERNKTNYLRSYVWNTTSNNSWILVDEVTSGYQLLDSHLYFQIYGNAEGETGQTRKTFIEFDNLYIETSEPDNYAWWYSTNFGTGAVGWLSPNITLSTNPLESITVNYTNADDYTFLKIVCLYQNLNVIGCKDFSFETTTTNGTGVTLTEEDFDFATWGYDGFVNLTDDFNIYVAVEKNNNNGFQNTGLVITEVSGMFAEESLPPIVSNLFFDDDIEELDEEINLAAGSTQTVTCFGTISDADGYDDIVSANATIYSNISTLESSDNNNSHYSNTICTLSSGFDMTKKNATCTFDVYYYAEPGEWTCTLFGVDSSGSYNSNSTNSTLNPLIALNIGGNINFGDVPISEISDEVNVSIANYGNYQIDIEVSGTNMDCGLGSINVSYIKYNTTEYGQDYTESMTSLLDTPVLRTEFNLPKKTTIDGAFQTKNLSLRLKMPFGVKGNCTGSMQFTAYAG